jgi:hypothetical protein
MLEKGCTYHHSCKYGALIIYYQRSPVKQFAGLLDLGELAEVSVPGT